MTSTAKPCAATTAAGNPCGAFAVSGSLYCFAHDPARAGAAAEARRAGGRARHGRTVRGSAAPPQLVSPADVLAYLAGVAADLAGVEVSISRARAQIALAVAFARCWEAVELAGRVAALERLLSDEPH